MNKFYVGDYVRYKKHAECKCGDPETHIGWVSKFQGETVLVKTLLAGEHTYGSSELEYVPEG